MNDPYARTYSGTKTIPVRKQNSNSKSQNSSESLIETSEATSKYVAPVLL